MTLIQTIIRALTVHPIHTLLVHFPIALTTTAFFFILLALIKKNDLLEKIAFANLSLAAVSTIVAGAAGIMDNAKYYGGLAPNHTTKIILASTLFLLSSATAIIRWKTPNLFHSRAKWLYVLMFFIFFAIASVLGYLGGVIVYGK